MRKIQLLLAVTCWISIQSVWANDYGAGSARILKQAVGARTFAMGCHWSRTLTPCLVM